MQCDEKKEICLNYAANIPEWKLALILDALAKLGDASRCCGTVQKAVAGGQSYMRLHPDREYTGEDQADYVHICQEAARALGRAVYAVEIVLSQSECFGLTKDLAYSAVPGKAHLRQLREARGRVYLQGRKGHCPAGG